jgi:2-polyprenyl-3-methyl-5-hydroxy-6-metoxy-1,4-benzoquinol methylase
MGKDTDNIWNKMRNNEETKRNNYFEYRQVESSTYDGFKLPQWIKNELYNLDQKILDYGCGFGQTLEALKAEQFKKIYGVDIEKEAISQCLSKGLDIRELNLRNLINPFGFKFDVIIMTHVIEHIAKSEIIDTLTIIKNEFLCENGKLLISVPNAQSSTGCYWAYEDWTHTTLFTSGSLYYVLKAAGFKTIEYLDKDCVLGSSKIKTIVRKFFLELYRGNKKFWNGITCSSWHSPSPEIYSFEIKAKAF